MQCTTDQLRQFAHATNSVRRGLESCSAEHRAEQYGFFNHQLTAIHPIGATVRVCLVVTNCGGRNFLEGQFELDWTIGELLSGAEWSPEGFMAWASSEDDQCEQPDIVCPAMLAGGAPTIGSLMINAGVTVECLEEETVYIYVQYDEDDM